MKPMPWGALLALCVLPAWAQAQAGAPEIEWPLPWRAGVVLEYDQQYTSTDRRDGRDHTVSATDVVRISIVRADEDGYVQRWVSTDPAYDLTAMPEEMRLAVGTAAEAFRDLPMDVRLDAEGAYVGVLDVAALQSRYREALEQAFADVAGRADPALPAETRALLSKMTDALTAPAVIEQQFAELPAAYNFVAGGGLAPEVEYRYDDTGTSPLGGESIAMRNRMSLAATDDPDVYALHWRIEPDNAAITAIIRRFVDDLMQDQLKAAGPEQEAAYATAMAELGKRADFNTTVTYLVDGTTGVVQRMEHVQVKRIGNKDETSRTVLTRRR